METVSAAVAPATAQSPPAVAGTPARAAGLLVAVLVLGVLVVLSFAVGAKWIPPGEVLGALTGSAPPSFDTDVVTSLRAPRTFVAAIVGAALAVAGAVMQALTRNPLADPGLLGVNAGAFLGVSLAISVLGLTAPTQFVWLAFVGAAATSVLVYGLGARGRGGASPVRLVLAGTAVGAVLTGISSGIILFDVEAVDAMRFWAMGSVAGRDFALLFSLAPFLVAGLLLAVAIGPSLNAVTLGDEAAVGLGANVNRTRLLSALVCVLLCGAATAAAGPIGFVGLVVPHVVRLLVGQDQRWIMLYSAVGGAVLLLGADLIGRVVVSPAELEVSIVSAVIGAPVFLYLVRQRRMVRA